MLEKLDWLALKPLSEYKLSPFLLNNLLLILGRIPNRRL